MKKRMLDPGQLRVQSFTPAVRAAAEGHARGREATVTCIPRCGTVVRSESCYNGCTDPEIC